MSDGLDGVVVAETVLSHVDGAGGRLVIRGLPLEEVVRTMTFEQAMAHLWRGFVPEADDPAGLAASLGRARAAAFAGMGPLLPAARRLTPVEGLRLLLAGLGDGERLPHPVLAAAAVPVFVAALGRLSPGPGPARASVSPGHRRRLPAHAARPAGRAPRGAGARHLPRSPSPITASTPRPSPPASSPRRWPASCPPRSAGLCALKGPLHGGAPGPVLDMLDAIGSEPHGRWSGLEAELAPGAGS